jgi:teichuronic acid biosynthesis glycosyltransferase TuaG
MPTFNNAAHIGAAIESVQAQTRTDWELIVVNDCSTDDTAAIVERFAAADPRIRLINLDANMGAPAGPRNIAARAARGQYLALLDADDLWHPQKLDLQLGAIERTGARFVSAGLVDFHDGAEPEFTFVDRAPLQRITMLRTLINTKTPTSTVLAERDLFLRYPFNEDLAYKAREDLDCFLHMHEEIGASIKVLHPLLGYRITGGQQISGNKLTMIKRHYYVLSRYRGESGRVMGPAAALFTATHFGSALYHRAWRGRM